jgi:tRNA pseudouridine55 synthase
MNAPRTRVQRRPVHGVLLLDKPLGLSSNDALQKAKWLLRAEKAGHTGTLDPLATGVLPLACGRATRLVRFLTASDKDYEATIRFGLTTDTYDITGEETSRTDREPSRAAVDAAVASLCGEYRQMPPAYSAKKVGGRRAYAMARGDETVTLAAVPVRVSRADVIEFSGTRATVVLTCSAGFYVRSFAHELGIRVEAGACLETLRRTRSGDFRLSEAASLEALQDGLGETDLIPLERLLPALPAVRLTDEGLTRVSHGRGLEPGHFFRLKPEATAESSPSGDPVASGVSRAEDWIRLFDSAGRLAGLASAEPGGSLHPAIVLI